MIPGRILAASLLLSNCILLAASNRPNIVLIMADDLGYGDVSCYGATRLSTPNIDRLADEGIRFTNGYCSASTCTPTRFSLLTGTYVFVNKALELPHLMLQRLLSQVLRQLPLSFNVPITKPLSLENGIWDSATRMAQTGIPICDPVPLK